MSMQSLSQPVHRIRWRICSIAERQAGKSAIRCQCLCAKLFGKFFKHRLSFGRAYLIYFKVMHLEEKVKKCDEDLEKAIIDSKAEIAEQSKRVGNVY